MVNRREVYTIVRTTTVNELLSVEHQYKDIDTVLSEKNLNDIKSVELIGIRNTDVHRTQEFKEIIQLSRKGKIDGIVTSGIDQIIKVNSSNRSAILKAFSDINLKIYTPNQIINLNCQSEFLFGTEH